MAIILQLTPEQGMEFMLEYFRSSEYIDSLHKPNIVKNDKDFEERLNQANILLIHANYSKSS